MISVLDIADIINCMDRIKKEQTGIEPVTLGPAIPCSTTELLFLMAYSTFTSFYPTLSPRQNSTLVQFLINCLTILLLIFVILDNK